MSARILVVDDEANIRALIDEILSEENLPRPPRDGNRRNTQHIVLADRPARGSRLHERWSRELPQSG